MCDGRVFFVLQQESKSPHTHARTINVLSPLLRSRHPRISLVVVCFHCRAIMRVTVCAQQRETHARQGTLGKGKRHQMNKRTRREGGDKGKGDGHQLCSRYGTPIQTRGIEEKREEAKLMGGWKWKEEENGRKVSEPTHKRHHVKDIVSGAKLPKRRSSGK